MAPARSTSIANGCGHSQRGDDMEDLEDYGTPWITEPWDEQDDSDVVEAIYGRMGFDRDIYESEERNG